MQHNINVFLSGFIIVMCFVFAYFLLFTDMMNADGNLTGKKRTIFVVILLGYAVYRGYRLYVSIRENKQQEDED